jgi:hypothetical protein
MKARTIDPNFTWRTGRRHVIILILLALLRRLIDWLLDLVSRLMGKTAPAPQPDWVCTRNGDLAGLATGMENGIW